MRAKLKPTTWLRYAVGVAVATIALGVWLGFGTLVAPSPFPLLLGAVAVSAWYGGREPGLLATLVGAVGSAFFYSLPAAQVAGRVPLSDAVQLTVFVLVGFLISSLSQNLQEARQLAEAAQRRAAFLAEAGRVLSSSLEYKATLETVARLAVPQFATWCVVDMVEQGTPRLLAVTHADPGKEQVVRELRERYPFDPQAPHGLPKVLRSGTAELYPTVSPAWRRAAARDPEHLRLMDELDATSSMCVPLVARGRTLGAITFVRTARQRPFSPADLRLAEELAGRAALAIDNAGHYRDAQEALRLRDEFLASVSHDLRNPLAAIHGHVQLAQRYLDRLGPSGLDKVMERLQHIEAVERRMGRVLNELVDVANLRAGKELELQCEETDLVRLATQAVEDKQLSVSAHRIRLDARVPELVGRWDAGRLERVLANLLSNAVKFSPAGGEVLVVVRHEECSGSGRAVVEVQDQGVGIPAADLPRVFERFHRAANVAGRISGSGIGLATSREIVERHGGRLEVESVEGQGSTFTVRLPLDGCG